MTQGAEIPAERQNSRVLMLETGNSLPDYKRDAHESIPFDMDTIIGFDVLYRSMLKCKSGVMWKDSVASFCLNWLERIIKLEKELKDGTYKARPTVEFKITSPKPRDIASICFRDRVYQRSLNDNALYPIMSNGFIYDNWACQKGKGTDAARNRMKEFLRAYYRRYKTNDGWVAQFDIHGYYPNMKHSVAEAKFKKELPDDVYKLTEAVLNHQYKGDVGYNPGSQMIQIAGISVLDEYDHFSKEDMRCGFYERFMDDFIGIFNKKDDAEMFQSCSIDFIHKNMLFEFNKKKTVVYNLKDGIEYLGFVFKLTETGKVLMFVKHSKIKEQRRKLAHLVSRSKRGLIPRYKVNESYAAMRNHLCKGDSKKTVIQMDAYYKSLWEDC